jgi:transposase
VFSTVEKLDDPALVKQAALLLEHENARLHARLQELTAEIAKLKGNDGHKQLQLEMVRLQEQMATLRQDMFGASSEKRKAKDERAMPRPPRDGHGPRQQTELPIEEHAHELGEADRVCPECGATLAEWEGQTEDSEEITVVERHFVVRRHRRKKYRCKHGCAPVTAPGTLKLVEGGRYSVEFAVYVAIAKYLYHLPLERQVRMYEANGLVVDSQTLWDQELRGAVGRGVRVATHPRRRDVLADAEQGREQEVVRVDGGFADHGRPPDLPKSLDRNGAGSAGGLPRHRDCRRVRALPDGGTRRPRRRATLHARFLLGPRAQEVREG